jgi:glycosyltransferase involved in cell wall biosynthesis
VERRGRRRGRHDRRNDLTPGDITFVILTKNEAPNLPRALGSVPLAARVLVIDAESTDATVELARRRGARAIVRPWAGFIATRRFALAQVDTAWTFMLDADEALDPAMRAALVAADPSDRVLGYLVRRRTMFCGRVITGSGWGDEVLLRFFRTEAAQLVANPAAGGEAELHESWQVPGDVERLAGTLLHDSYPTLGAYRHKYARYTSLEAQGMRATPAGTVRTFGVALARLPWLFFWRGGWRDGWRGAFIAFASAFYPVVVHLKALRR